MRDVKVVPPTGGPHRIVRSILIAAMAALLIDAGLARSDEPKQGAAQTETGIPPQAEPPVQTEAEEARGREQRVLRQVIFRDRQTQSTVDQAESAFRSGDAPRAIGLLQQILDQSGDHFVWVERDRRLVSARHRALGLLSSADAKTRALYDWAYSREAKRLLDAGKTTGDPLLIAEVARRFFPHILGIRGDRLAGDPLAGPGRVCARSPGMVPVGGRRPALLENQRNDAPKGRRRPAIPGSQCGDFTAVRRAALGCAHRGCRRSGRPRNGH
jgi:hypothetical protein